MKLYEILKNCDKDKVIAYLAGIDDRNGPSVYSEMFDKLIAMNPSDKSNMKILVCQQIDLFDTSISYYDVSGIKDGEDTFYALEFTPWDEWLASEVLEKPIKEYGEDVVIGEILYEMSFISFDESEIQDSRESLEKQCEEIKNGNAKLYPFDVPKEDAESESLRKKQVSEIMKKNSYKRRAMLD